LTLSRGSEPPVVEIGGPLPCERCYLRIGLMSASIPRDGVEGRHTVVLCPSCDAGDAAAGPIITFFLVHGRISDETVEEFSKLALTWTRQLRPPAYDEQAFEADVESWYTGDFDDSWRY
jgi:hypothetical protein